MALRYLATGLKVLRRKPKRSCTKPGYDQRDVVKPVMPERLASVIAESAARLN